MNIKTYDELENLTIEELEANRTEKGTFKSYTYYIVKNCGEYGTCLFVTHRNNIIYIDEQLFYDNDITYEELIKAMKSKLATKIFDFAELQAVTSYTDYRDKMDFLNNRYSKIYNAVSCFKREEELTEEQRETKAKGHFAKRISFAYYNNQEEVEQLNLLYDDLKNAIVECLKDEKQQEIAIRYELRNYECFYTYDIEDVLFLKDYGISEQKIIEVFKKCLKQNDNF